MKKDNFYKWNVQGQIWVESVLYTLIGLTLIGLTLAIVYPRIAESRDRAVVEQSIEVLNVFDTKINEVLLRGEGNVRSIPEFTLRRGEFSIDAGNNILILTIRGLRKPYSEVNKDISIGNVHVKTSLVKKNYDVELKVDYTPSADIVYGCVPPSSSLTPAADCKLLTSQGGANKVIKTLNVASRPYAFSIENIGADGIVVGSRIFVNIKETTGA